MSEVSLELIFKLVQQVRAGQQEMQAEQGEIKTELHLVNKKFGALAEGMVSLRRQLDEMRTDMRMMALAVDEHTTRLDRIESLLPHHSA